MIFGVGALADYAFVTMLESIGYGAFIVFGSFALMVRRCCRQRTHIEKWCQFVCALLITSCSSLAVPVTLPYRVASTFT